METRSVAHNDAELKRGATNPGVEPYTQPLRQFARDQNISPTLVYRWIDSGDIDTVLIGTRRHVVLPSYRRMIDRLRAEQGRLKLSSSNPKVKAKRTAAASSTDRHISAAPPKKRRRGRSS